MKSGQLTKQQRVALEGMQAEIAENVGSVVISEGAVTAFVELSGNEGTESTGDLRNSSKSNHNTITNYKKTFFGAYPELKGSVVVHHAIEQQVLKRYNGLFNETEIHALGNLRGVPKDVNNSLHLSKLRKEWNKFYRENPNPTKDEIINHMKYLDKKHGDKFNPK